MLTIIEKYSIELLCVFFLSCLLFIKCFPKIKYICFNLVNLSKKYSKTYVKNKM